MELLEKTGWVLWETGMNWFIETYINFLKKFPKCYDKKRIAI